MKINDIIVSIVKADSIEQVNPLLVSFISVQAEKTEPTQTMIETWVAIWIAGTSGQEVLGDWVAIEKERAEKKSKNEWESRLHTAEYAVQENEQAIEKAIAQRKTNQEIWEKFEADSKASMQKQLDDLLSSERVQYESQQAALEIIIDQSSAVLPALRKDVEAIKNERPEEK